MNTEKPLALRHADALRAEGHEAEGLPLDTDLPGPWRLVQALLPADGPTGTFTRDGQPLAW